MVSLPEIEKLAKLSRIQMTGEEKESLRKEIDSILNYVAEIKEVSENIEGGGKGNEMPRNVMRADENPHESGAYSEEIIREFPKKEGGYLKVKKIL